MTHLDEGLILVLRDDPAAAPPEAALHAEHCSECRAALDGTRARGAAVASALRALDDDTWELEAARMRVRERVSAASARAAGVPSLAAGRRSWGALSLSRAAGILLVAAAGLSALPGSPVRTWLTQQAAPTAASSSPEVGATSALAEEPVEEGGVRIPLTGGSVTVVLQDAAPGTEIRVRWITGREAALFAAPGTRFTSGQGRIEAAGLSGVVRLELPRGGVSASLEVNGRRVLRSTAEGVELAGPVVGETEAGVTFRIPTP